MERPPSKRKAMFANNSKPKAAKTEGGMSFAERMMAKMGYKEGEGLGKEGSGILNPIEVKLRPQGAGVGAVKEKTAQAKAEAKRQAERRGEEYEDSSEEERKARERRKKIMRTAGASGTTSGASTPGGYRQKVKYRTVADIEANADGLHVPNVLKSLIDATGKEQKLLTSTSGLMTPTAGVSAADTEVEKIARRAKLDLEAFAESWNTLTEKKKDLDYEENQLQRELDNAQEEIRKMQGVVETVAALGNLDLNRSRMHDDAIAKWEEVTTQLETIQVEYRDELHHFGLSDAAIAAIQPLFKQEMLDWEPLDNPMHLVAYLNRLKTILGINKYAGALDSGRDPFEPFRQQKSTTAYETMIYTLWLPKIRTVIINDWDPHAPTALLTLIEAWKDHLPRFVYHNVLDQLIEQKLSAAVQSWNPRTALKKKKHAVPLPHIWLFPWLQFLSDRHIDPCAASGLLVDVKRKFRVALDSWDLSRGVIPGLENWREVLRSELDHALIRHLLPRFATLLEADFEINPADQDMKPLEWVFAWNSFFKPSYMGELLAQHFFPKWHRILHAWLTAPEANYEEVGAWYSWWKGMFPEEITAVPAVAEEWERGLQLINEALDLGERVADELKMPRVRARFPIDSPLGTPNARATPIKEPRSARKDAPEERGFKDVVEEWCGEESLLLIALREAHERTGLPLFRITASATGRGGVLVYLKGDVVYAQNRKDKSVWEPVGLDEELISKAEGK